MGRWKLGSKSTVHYGAYTVVESDDDSVRPCVCATELEARNCVEQHNKALDALQRNCDAKGKHIKRLEATLTKKKIENAIRYTSDETKENEMTTFEKWVDLNNYVGPFKADEKGWKIVDANGVDASLYASYHRPEQNLILRFLNREWDRLTAQRNREAKAEETTEVKEGPYICDVRTGCVAVYRGPQVTCLIGMEKQAAYHKMGVYSEQTHWSIDPKYIEEAETLTNVLNSNPSVAEYLEKLKKGFSDVYDDNVILRKQLEEQRRKIMRMLDK